MQSCNHAYETDKIFIIGTIYSFAIPAPTFRAIIRTMCRSISSMKIVILIPIFRAIRGCTLFRSIDRYNKAFPQERILILTT